VCGWQPGKAGFGEEGADVGHPRQCFDDCCGLALKLVFDRACWRRELEAERDAASAAVHGQVLHEATVDDVHGKVWVDDRLESLEHLQARGCEAGLGDGDAGWGGWHGSRMADDDDVAVGESSGSVGIDDTVARLDADES